MAPKVNYNVQKVHFGGLKSKCPKRTFLDILIDFWGHFSGGGVENGIFRTLLDFLGELKSKCPKRIFLDILIFNFCQKGRKGAGVKGAGGRKLSHFSFCCAFRCCVVYSPCFRLK